VELPSVSESMDRQGRKLKSENSFACSFDSYNDSMCPDSRDELPVRSSKMKGKDQPSVAKASLADRSASSQLLRANTRRQASLQRVGLIKALLYVKSCRFCE
jgi:hypothetical protein